MTRTRRGRLEREFILFVRIRSERDAAIHASLQSARSRDRSAVARRLLGQGISAELAAPTDG